MKKIVINKDKCKGCGLCVAACPKKSLKMSEDFNESGYNTVVFEDNDECISCGFCYQVCPEACIEVYK